MSIEQYIEQLFSRYEHNPAMEDFKEEISTNLKERIHYMQEKGLSQEQAFRKATEELGDITEIADEICEEKRKEVISSMYMMPGNYLKKAHVTGYVTAGTLLLTGIFVMLFMYLRSGSLSVMLSSAIILCVPAIAGFVALGLTQETATHEPMKKKRALGYAGSTALLLTGILLFCLLWLRNQDLSHAIAGLIVLFVPGCILAAILGLTETDRTKPWMRERQAISNAKYEELFNDPYMSTKFGLCSGALWILASTLFLALGFALGFRYSWLVFPFAVAVQLLLQALLMKKES